MWKEIWPTFLREAASAACQARSAHGKTQTARVAVSIILSRTAWEAYFIDFVRRRDLPKHVARQKTQDAIAAVRKELNIALDSPSWDPGDLVLLSELRNELVHHKPLGLSENETLRRVCTGLVRASLIEQPSARCAWENALLRPAVAEWACHTVKNAVIAWESNATKRERSPYEVQRNLDWAISPLASECRS